MMMKAWFSIAVVLGVTSVAWPAQAKPLSVTRLKQATDDPDAWLIDGRYMRGEARLARMRKNGELPDTLRAGRCRYDLAGDPGVAYYVRTCR